MVLTEDVRKRVVIKRLAGLSFVRIAEDLLVSRNTASEIWTQFVDTGDYRHTPQPHFDAFATKMRLEQIKLYIDADNKLQLKELAGLLLADSGIFPSVPTLSRVMATLRYTKKRLERASINADPLDQHLFVHDMQQYTLDQCVWVDETGHNNQDLERRSGWAPAGQRAHSQNLRPKGPHYSSICAMTNDGVLAYHMIQGGFTGAELEFFGENMLLPLMNPYPGKHSVLVMDNAKTHWTLPFVLLCLARGVRICYMSPYSPQYMPCEDLFSQIKSWINTNGAFLERLGYNIIEIVERAYAGVTAGDCQGFIRGCGYSL